MEEAIIGGIVSGLVSGAVAGGLVGYVTVQLRMNKMSVKMREKTTEAKGKNVVLNDVQGSQGVTTYQQIGD